MRHQQTVKAVPVSIRFKEVGYELAVKIVEGPAAMLDRVVKVVFTSDQLDAIEEWEPNVIFSYLQLDKLTPKE